MIDLNDQKTLTELRSIKQHPHFDTFLKYVRMKIDELGDIDNIETETDLLASKKAVKIIKEVFNFIK